jgi:hypothetical protein
MKRVLLVFLFCALGAFAGPVNLDQWYGFAWSGTALPLATYGYDTASADASVLNPGDSPWTITLTAPAYLVLVDGYSSGDRFEAFDGAVSLGLTSLVAAGAQECAGGDGPIHCLADNRFSSGSFLLGVGDHSLSITTVSGSTSGAAWFEVDEVDAGIPEPSTLSLVGLAGFAILAWRRQR